jgi:hypothetical protein
VKTPILFVLFDTFVASGDSWSGYCPVHPSVFLCICLLFCAYFVLFQTQEGSNHYDSNFARLVYSYNSSEFCTDFKTKIHLMLISQKYRNWKSTFSYFKTNFKTLLNSLDLLFALFWHFTNILKRSCKTFLWYIDQVNIQKPVKEGMIWSTGLLRFSVHFVGPSLKGSTYIAVCSGRFLDHTPNKYSILMYICVIWTWNVVMRTSMTTRLLQTHSEDTNINIRTIKASIKLITELVLKWLSPKIDRQSFLAVRFR